MLMKSEHRKELVSEIRSLAQSQGLNTVSTTFLEITANSLAAQTDPENAEKRERRYQEMASTMTPELLSSYARMLALLFLTVREYRDDPCDILGGIYHELNLNNEWNGQYFTPDDVCRLMAQITLPSDELSANDGPITINEPTCGSGTMVMDNPHMENPHGENPAQLNTNQVINNQRNNSLNKYDSDDYKGTTGGLEVVMRSIIYAAYSKDLSVKTTTAKIQMMKQGKYVGGYAPYGYVLHPEIRNKLKLDPEAAEVVRRVFDEALEGRNTSQIALSLNDDNIPTPGQYFKGKHPDKKKYSRMSEKISWTASMVYKILTSYVYTGATVGHKRKSGGVGSRKTISQKKEEWIIVEGMHEAIVSKEEFELAQAVIRGGEKNPKRNLRYYPLKGLVCCGNCKRALTRRKLRNEGGYFYQCTYSTHDRDTECPVGERYSEAWIEDTAYKAIGQMLTLVEKKAVKEHEISKRRKSAITECADAIRDLQKQYEQLKAVKLRLYEKYTSGSITKAEYLKRKAETDAKMSENEEAIQQGHQRMQELDSEHPCSDERLDAVLGEYQKGAGLTYELAHALISAIYIHGHDSIEIVWQFKDIFEDAEI